MHEKVFFSRFLWDLPAVNELSNSLPFIRRWLTAKTGGIERVGSLLYEPAASFTKEGNPRLAKHPLVFNGCLANRGIISLVKEATGVDLVLPECSGLSTARVNPLHAEFSIGNIKCIYDLYHSSTLTWQVVEHKNLPILHSQYHGCWCPGDVRSQAISNHDFDYIETE